MREIFGILYVLVILALIGTHAIAAYLGFRLAAHYQAAIVDETLFQIGKVTRPIPIEGTALGEKFREHLRKKRSEENAIPETKAARETGHGEGQSIGKPERSQCDR